MIVEPFKRKHLENFEPQEGQGEFGLDIMDTFETYSMIKDGKVIAFAGLINNRGWTLLSKDARKHLLSITRLINNFIENRKIDRLEMFVRCDFREAVRWARILNFKRVDNVRVLPINGEEYGLYVRQK